MATVRITDVIRHVRRLHQLRAEGSQNDGQLLERFFQHSEQAAFEMLVERYGSMVLGVCQRLLRNGHDTEDAFQAVFLVVLHKGRSLLGRETIGNWLYGVAYNTALKARAASVLRRSKESKAPAKQPCPEEDENELVSLRPLLDQEISKLPDKLREAVVLCEVLGKSRKDAARQLGIPEGTLSSRLAAARNRLAERLKRQGATLSAATLAVCLCQTPASACVPGPLVARTVETAIALATGTAATGSVVSPSVAALVKGVLKTMFVSKCKTAATLVLGVLLSALGVASLSALAAPKRGKKPDVAQTADRRASTKNPTSELTPESFAKLYRLIKPDPKQSFESVPWLTSLWAARQQAANEDKPIVLWAGDPLPLGIT